jgi:carbonic anhydrase
MGPADAVVRLTQLNAIESSKRIKSHPSVLAATTPVGNIQVHGMMYYLSSGTLFNMGIPESGDVVNARIGAF